MAKVIGIMGESGSGKTTSLETLNPEETFYFDCDKKGLAWKGWRNQYNTTNKNYWKSDNAGIVLSGLQKIDKDESYKRIKVVVIDTINALMVADENRRRREKGYDKWTDLAWAVYDIYNYALSMRDDVTVILIAHVQVDREDNGYMFAHIKTSGKKLDKIGIETQLPTLLYAKAIPDGEDNVQYIFETKAMNSTAKTPKGAFDKFRIPNDMGAVLKALEDY